MNSELVYSKLRSIFDGFVSKGKEEKSTLKTEKKTLVHVQSYEDLDKECLSKRRACFIGLLNGKSYEEQNYNRNVKMLEELVEKDQNKPYSYLYVNATCHDELLQEFNINVDSLPNAIIYVPTKDVYTSLIGTFDEESINSFMSRVINGKVSMQSTTKDKFKVTTKDCSTIQEEVVASSDDDDIMREMMEEIQRKQEQQKIEDEEKSKKKKNKKKKKKSKKSDL